jgi:hypothetical protein
VRDPSDPTGAKATPAEEAYRLLVQCCCAVGGLAGLWLGFLAGLGRPGSPDADAALAAVLVPVGWRVAAGVITGALVAGAVAAAIAWLRPAGRR